MREFKVPILLPADPTQDNQAATKHYVDSVATGGTPGVTVKDEGALVASNITQLDFLGAEISVAVGSGGVTITVKRLIGEIINYGLPGALPSNEWLECDGAMCPDQYPVLKAALGTTYGAAGTLPDLRIKHVAGVGTYPIAGVKNLGDTWGVEQRTLVSTNIPGHVHSLANHTHTLSNHSHGITHYHGMTHTHDSNSRPVAGPQTNNLAGGGGTAAVDNNIAVKQFSGNTGGALPDANSGTPNTNSTGPDNSSSGDGTSGGGLKDPANPFYIFPPSIALRWLIYAGPPV